MAELLFSVENEMAFSVIGWKRRGDSPPCPAELIVSLVADAVPHLYDASGGSGIYLANGSRLYVDIGNHPEISHAEATDPWTLVRLILANEVILSRAAQSLLRSKRGIREVILSHSNVDYRTVSTWGCHENYFCAEIRADLRERLVPFLISRLIYTGAGGFDPLRGGPIFSLSPRASFIESEVSDNSTGLRGIYHTKHEPLGRTGARLHLICGESLSSHLGLFLKSGVTALVVAVLLADPQAAADLVFKKPLTALRIVAKDTTLSRKLPMGSGRDMTALEIQWCYLSAVEKHLGDPFLPEWAQEVCREWRAILERLQEGVPAVSLTLDWAIKLELYRCFVARRGFSWDSLPLWTRISRQMSAAADYLPFGCANVSPDSLLERLSPGSETLRDLNPFLKRHGLEWHDFPAFVSLWNELIEMERRFGMLGETGIFNRMDSAGLVDHRVAGVDNIEEMILNPPSRGRAKIRGDWVKRLSGPYNEYLCDWQFIEQLRDGKPVRHLDLSDPFETESRWTTNPPRRLLRLDIAQLRLGLDRCAETLRDISTEYTDQ